MAQPVKAFGAKADDVSPISGTQIEEGEEGFLQVVLVCTHVSPSPIPMHIHINT